MEVALSWHMHVWPLLITKVIFMLRFVWTLLVDARSGTLASKYEDEMHIVQVLVYRIVPQLLMVPNTVLGDTLAILECELYRWIFYMVPPNEVMPLGKLFKKPDQVGIWGGRSRQPKPILDPKQVSQSVL